MLNLFCHLVRFYNLVLSLQSESTECLKGNLYMEKEIDEKKQGQSLVLDQKEGNTKKLFIENLLLVVFFSFFFPFIGFASILVCK